MTDRLGRFMLGSVLGIALLFAGYLAGALLERIRCHRTPAICGTSIRAADPAATSRSRTAGASRAAAPAWLP